MTEAWRPVAGFEGLYCKNGHAFAGANLRMQGTKRVCRACERASGATYRARMKERA